jgi:hypothetical protein
VGEQDAHVEGQCDRGDAGAGERAPHLQFVLGQHAGGGEGQEDHRHAVRRDRAAGDPDTRPSTS